MVTNDNYDYYYEIAIDTFWLDGQLFFKFSIRIPNNRKLNISSSIYENNIVSLEEYEDNELIAKIDFTTTKTSDSEETENIENEIILKKMISSGEFNNYIKSDFINKKVYVDVYNFDPFPHEHKQDNEFLISPKSNNNDDPLVFEAQHLRGHTRVIIGSGD